MSIRLNKKEKIALQYIQLKEKVLDTDLEILFRIDKSILDKLFDKGLIWKTGFNVYSISKKGKKILIQKFEKGQL